MTQTISRTSQYLTMEEYLAHDDGTDKRYELVDGELVEMSVEDLVNVEIATFLLFEFAKYVPRRMLAIANLEIEVGGKRAKTRIPDLAIHSQDSRAALNGQKRAILLRDMPPPALVVEVVSPGKENRDRYYRFKHTEYAARGISEYWIIDPEAQKITVCLWVNGRYEDTVYS
ncbi:MAG: Uma2 family endonuclease, partial [Cyanobacteria bacterium J06639_1]